MTKKYIKLGNIIKYTVFFTTKDDVEYCFEIFSESEFLERLHAEFRRNPASIVKLNYQEIQPELEGPLSKASGLILMMSFATSMIFLFMLMRGNKKKGQGMGGLGGLDQTLGKTLAKKFTAENVKTKFNDVAGLEEAKVELLEFVEFLKNPDKYKVRELSLEIRSKNSKRSYFEWSARYWKDLDGKGSRRGVRGSILCGFRVGTFKTGLNSWRCLWAWEHLASVTYFLKRRKRKRR